RFYSVSIVVLIKSSSSQKNKLNISQYFHGGTDPYVNGWALQHILLPLLQNPPSVPVLLTPHKIGLPAEYQTDPLDAPFDGQFQRLSIH
ncbi:MAG: hypothetical protein EZS28_048234, partial [Streblomastix strix]